MSLCFIFIWRAPDSKEESVWIPHEEEKPLPQPPHHHIEVDWWALRDLTASSSHVTVTLTHSFSHVSPLRGLDPHLDDHVSILLPRLRTATILFCLLIPHMSTALTVHQAQFFDSCNNPWVRYTAIATPKVGKQKCLAKVRQHLSSEWESSLEQVTLLYVFILGETLAVHGGQKHAVSIQNRLHLESV